jgi:hypothetical protein
VVWCGVVWWGWGPFHVPDMNQRLLYTHTIVPYAGLCERVVNLQVLDRHGLGVCFVSSLFE